MQIWLSFKYLPEFSSAAILLRGEGLSMGRLFINNFFKNFISALENEKNVSIIRIELTGIFPKDLMSGALFQIVVSCKVTDMTDQILFSTPGQNRMYRRKIITKAIKEREAGYEKEYHRNRYAGKFHCLLCGRDHFQG